ncbi:MAG: DUF2203 family protein [Actinobacteria bacterium]|nr:DUF2203 family protein [Actinomycetota bacterium]
MIIVEHQRHYRYYSGMIGHTPDRSTAAGEKRLFSVEQANSSLPLVKRIAHDIIQTAGEVRDYQEQFESLQSKGDPGQAESTMAKIAKTREKYQQLLRELSALGCRLGDEISGTVEFPAVVNGRQVVLSWRMGESQINHWHDLGQDSQERRLLAELNG